MKIIKYKKVNSNQYELLLEDKTKLRLYEDVIIKEELLLKKEIDNLLELIDINNNYACYDDALKYLNKKVRCTKEVYDYLNKKGYSNVSLTMDKLIEKGYIDDAYYTKCFVNDKINLGNDGPIKIRKMLEINNIEEDIINNNLEVFDEELMIEKIDNYLNKQLKVNKKSNYMFKSKMLLNLVNMGYPKELVTDRINKLHFDNQDDLKKSEEAKIRKKLEHKYSGEELERKIKEKLYQKGYFE